MTKKQKTGYLKRFRNWHRWAGMFASLFVTLLVVTGILLNHTDGLKLKSSHVKARWMLAWYGIKPVGGVRHYLANNNSLVQIGRQLYFNGIRLLKVKQELIGAVYNGKYIVAGLRDRILLLSNKGQLIETIKAYQGLPVPLNGIHYRQKSGLILVTANGHFRFDPEQLSSTRSGLIIKEQVRSSLLAPAIKQKLVQDYQGVRLSWERVLLDIHTGRFFGQWGVYLIDLSAMILLFLAISGWWMWLRSRKRNAGRNAKQQIR